MKTALIVLGIILLLGFGGLSYYQHTQIRQVRYQQFIAKGSQIDWDKILSMSEGQQRGVACRMEFEDRQHLKYLRADRGLGYMSPDVEIIETKIPYVEFK